jgi:hypothetical protein
LLCYVNQTYDRDYTLHILLLRRKVLAFHGFKEHLCELKVLARWGISTSRLLMGSTRVRVALKARQSLWRLGVIRVGFLLRGRRMMHVGTRRVTRDIGTVTCCLLRKKLTFDAEQ